MSSVSNDSHIDWRKWMDADVSVRNNKWRNKCKAFWVLSDKCLHAHVYWLGAVFLSLPFIKALIKSYGQILQTPQRQWLCLMSRVQGEQEVDTNCVWSYRFRETIIFQQQCQCKGSLYKHIPWTTTYLHPYFIHSLCRELQKSFPFQHWKSGSGGSYGRYLSPSQH